MTDQTQEWAERVGREAVALGMPCSGGLLMLDWYGSTGDRTPTAGYHGWPSAVLPDFRDRLTALACIAWVEDVARETYGEGFRLVQITHGDIGSHAQVHFVDAGGAHCVLDAEAKRFRDTLPGACIAAVRAMKGGE